MKNRKRIMLVILVFFPILCCYLMVEVYGGINWVAALRSRFMKDTIVPIVSSLITFGGVAVSIHFTLKTSHSNKLSELNQQKADELHKRDLLAKEIIGKSRLAWIKDVRDTYKEYIVKVQEIRSLLISNTFVRTIDITDNSPNFQDIQYETSRAVQEFVGLSDVLISYFNPQSRSITEKCLISRLDLYKETIDLTRSDVEGKVAESYEKLIQKESIIIDFHIIPDMKNTLKDFDVKLVEIKEMINLCLKVEWERIKKEIIKSE